MEIIFGKHFDKGYFLDYSLPENQNIFNRHIVGPMGLLNILERDLCLMAKNLQLLERRILYQGILSDYLKTHPDTIYTDSFVYDPDGSTEELLRCRDQLILSGWNKKIKGISAKVDFLSDIEKESSVPVGIEDRWIKVLNAIDSLHDFAFGFTALSIAEPREDNHPFFARLFDALAVKGIEIKHISYDFAIDSQTNLGRIKIALIKKSFEIELDEADKKSFQILRFKSDADAAEFIASQYKVLSEAVILNRNNSLFDEMLNSFGLPVAGSNQVDANPMLIQLIKLIASLLVKPLNIHNLMSYLQVEIHPVPASLRSGLLKVIKEKGGIKNTEWYHAIENFNFKDAAHKKSCINFLTVRELVDDKIKRNEAVLLYRSLESWAQKRLILKQNEPAVSGQLKYLLDMCMAVINVLESRSEETISVGEFGLIINGVYEPDSFMNYESQVGACRVISIPGQLISSPKKCIWLDCYNEEMKPSWYSFLNQAEIDRLTEKGMLIWNTADQTRASADSLMHGLLRPFKQCVIVLSEKANGDTVSDHPVFSMLKAMMPAIESFIIDASDITHNSLLERGWITPQKIQCNSSILPEKKLEHRIDNGKLVPGRLTESASSIELLIQSPFDWIMQYGVKIQAGYSFQLDDVSQTMGKVAHKFIEVLLTMAENETAAARSLMVNYDTLLQEITDGFGMLLLLDEHRFEYERFKISLRTAVITLLDLLDENQLKVVGMETNLKANILSLGNQEFAGFIDLILVTADNKRAIFDLKWSRRPQKFIEKIKENKHIQLVIYKELLQAAEKVDVEFVAYYSLSDARLITTASLNGECVITLKDIMREADILTILQNSIAYRKAQIHDGVLEEGEGIMPLDEISYYRDQENKNLISLDIKDGKKKINTYSSYKVFKGDII